MTSTLVGRHLVELPDRYDQLATDLNEKFVAAYGAVPDEPALCLVTGAMRDHHLCTVDMCVPE